nr:hypothetical protein [Tanacetum cinerariifolium]
MRTNEQTLVSQPMPAVKNTLGKQQAGSESCPHMLNKENYVPWLSRLLRYAKSRPNGKLIHNSILNRPYVRKMIPEPGDANREITVTETFHLETDDELFDKELKQIEADDQAIQTILLGLPEDIYAAVDSCETAQKIWLQVQQMMKGSDIRIQEKKAKLFNEWERFTSNEGELIESYYHRFLKLMNDLKRNKHFLEKIASNLKFLNNLQPEWSRHVTIVHQSKDLHTADYTQLYDLLNTSSRSIIIQSELLATTNANLEDITDPTTAMNMALALMAKAFKLNYSTPTNNNQRISSNPRNKQIAQSGMNIGQDRQMQMIGGERKPRKGQNRIKTEQKQESCRSREKFKAVAVNKGRKTEQNAKRMAKNANAVKSYSSFKKKEEKRGKSAISPKFNHKGQNCQISKDVKENQEKDKIESKPDKNGKRVETEKSLKQLQ